MNQRNKYKMNPLKEAIFIEVRKIESDLQPLNDIDMNKHIFHHQDGLRLSLAGFIVLRKIFTVYSFEMPITIKSRHQRNLSTLTYPYFFTKKRLVLFSSQDAMMIKLCGSIELFLEDH
jgi:hypothetical protein